MFFLRRKIEKSLTTKDVLTTYDVLALQKLTGIIDNYIPWTGSAIRPGAILKILNDIIINKRKNIIEFGGGISTLYIAYMLKKNGGHLYTVEHDENWIAIVRDMLKKENIDDAVTFIHAPMKKSTYSLNDLDWYSESSLDILSDNDKFDLVLIDGPLAYTKKLMLSRYPAVPFLMKKNKIAENATIILDDIHRNGEKTIVKKWEREFGFKFVNLEKEAGIAIRLSSDAYTI